MLSAGFDGQEVCTIFCKIVLAVSTKTVCFGGLTHLFCIDVTRKYLLSIEATVD